MVRLLTRLFLCAIMVVAGLAPTIAAAADTVASGKAVFASQCSICHSNARNGPR